MSQIQHTFFHPYLTSHISFWHTLLPTSGRSQFQAVFSLLLWIFILSPFQDSSSSIRPLNILRSWRLSWASFLFSMRNRFPGKSHLDYSSSCQLCRQSFTHLHPYPDISEFQILIFNHPLFISAWPHTDISPRQSQVKHVIFPWNPSTLQFFPPLALPSLQSKFPPFFPGCP